MYYSDGISLFKSKYKTLSFNRKVDVQNLTNAEIMMYLSMAAQWLNHNYKIAEKLATVDLVQSQSLYTTGSGATNIPKDLHLIKTVEINQDGDNKVEVTSKEVVNETAKLAGLPTMLTVYLTADNRVLEINSNPTYSYDATSAPEYRLNILYTPRLDIFDSQNTITYSTYNETSTGFGGSFLLPPEWTGVMVDLALSEIFMDLKPGIMQIAEKMARDVKPKYVAKDLKYRLGVW